jgi:DNA repair protein RecO (recombination protein O)
VPSPALLLSRTHYGETSLVATVLSPRHGRVRLLAKGAYRSTSRFFGVLDAFHTLELDWRPAKGDGLALLTGGDWLRRRRAIPSHGVAYRAAWTVLETAKLVARDDLPEPHLFELVERALDGLDAAALRGDERGARLVRLAFDLRTLRSLGLAPALAHCAHCGRPAPPTRSAAETTLFAPDQGGRLCRSCAGQLGPSVNAPDNVPSRLIEWTATLLASDVGRAGGTEPPGAAADRASLLALERLVDRFTAHHLDAGRKSLGAARTA